MKNGSTPNPARDAAETKEAYAPYSISSEALGDGSSPCLTLWFKAALIARFPLSDQDAPVASRIPSQTEQREHIERIAAFLNGQQPPVVQPTDVGAQLRIMSRIINDGISKVRAAHAVLRPSDPPSGLLERMTNWADWAVKELGREDGAA